MEGCTFRPITTHTLKARPRSSSSSDGTGRHRRLSSASGENSPAVFDKLYREAQAKHVFETVIRPQVVEAFEKCALRRPAPNAASPETVEAATNRLYAEARELEERRRLRSVEPEHKPRISRRSKALVQNMELNGDRHPDQLQRLAARPDGNSEEALDRAIEAELERQRRALVLEERQRARAALERERVRSLLQAKFRELKRHVCQQQKEHFSLQSPVLVRQLAKAGVDVLSAEEASELLSVLEFCGASQLRERGFVSLVFNYAAEKTGSDGAYVSPLCTLPAPAPRRATPRRSTPPTVLAAVARERADPAALEEVRRKREEQMRVWREEAYRRENPPASTFASRPHRLIPYDCRPDVQIEVKSTRSMKLRQDYNTRRRHWDAVVGSEDPLRQHLRGWEPRTDGVRPCSRRESDNEYSCAAVWSPAPLNPKQSLTAAATATAATTATHSDTGMTRNVEASSTPLPESMSPITALDRALQSGGSAVVSEVDSAEQRGRQLLLSQMQEYHKRRSTSR